MQPLPQADTEMHASRVSLLARLVPSLSYIIGMAVAFQLRASWLFQVRRNERF
jgi:hypothetical protein